MYIYTIPSSIQFEIKQIFGLLLTFAVLFSIVLLLLQILLSTQYVYCLHTYASTNRTENVFRNIFRLLSPANRAATFDYMLSNILLHDPVVSDVGRVPRANYIKLALFT